MKSLNHKLIASFGQKTMWFLVVLVQFFQITDLLGQELLINNGSDEPIFVIRVEQIGTSDDISYSSNLEQTYAPCSQWVGGSGGFTGTPAEFISKAGGMGGLKPKMGIPFYTKKFSGTASGSDGSSATVVTIANGIGLWTEQLGDNQCKKQEDPSYQPSRNMSARFERTEKGARITFDAGIVSAGCATYIGFVSIHQMEVDPALVKQFCTFEISNEELSKWKQIKKKNTQVFKDDNGVLSATATLSMEVETPVKVEVEVVDYDKWIPEGNVKNPEKEGNNLRIKAKVIAENGSEEDREAKITFTLNNVSSEPGICINGPVSGEFDMQFTEENNEKTNFTIYPLEITTKKLVKETEVVVSSFDFGAYAELSVKAVDKDNKPIKVVLQGRDRSSMFLPKDELGGHIADAWRIKNEVAGVASSWDKEIIEGQKVNGDGLSLYEEYRGVLYSLGNKTEHTRLSPKKKELFVVDEAGILDAGLWESASKIKTVFVTKETTQGNNGGTRVVNFNSEYAKVGHKHAVVINTKEKPDSPTDLGEVNKGVTTPRDVTFCNVYSENCNGFIDAVISRLQKAIEDSDGIDAKHLRAADLPPWLWKKAYDRLDQETIDKLVAQQIRWTAIHELGHACGLKGHVESDISDVETTKGNQKCFMRYTENWENAMHIVLQIIFNLTPENPMDFSLFCTDEFNCMSSFNIKDP